MRPGRMMLTRLFFVVSFAILLNAGLEPAAVASPSNAAVSAPSHARTASLSRQRAERLNGIVEILESRIKNHQLPEKAKNKLVAMSDEEIRLVASLCSRMAGEDNTAGVDLALMLVTALIVLS